MRCRPGSLSVWEFYVACALTPLGFRVIVNEKPLNLKKTTSSVLSVLLGNFKILKSDFFNKNILLFRYDEESRGIKLNIQDDILKLKALM